MTEVIASNDFSRHSVASPPHPVTAAVGTAAGITSTSASNSSSQTATSDDVNLPVAVALWEEAEALGDDAALSQCVNLAKWLAVPYVPFGVDLPVSLKTFVWF